MSFITVENIIKKYDKRTVLDNINFQAENEFLFMAGKNGAGKTTFIKCATVLLAVNSGNVLYDGKSFDEVRQDIAVVFDEPKLYLDFTGYTNIKVFNQGHLDDAKNTEQVLANLELSAELLRRKVNTYSLGQKHRLAVAIAMIKKPKYMFLDEPTIGLDPISWELVKKSLIKQQKDCGLVAIITGQDYAEMEKLCQSIAILHNGTIVHNGSIKQLLNTFPKKVEFNYNGKLTLSDEFINTLSITNCENNSQYMKLEIPNDNVDNFISKIYEQVQLANLKIENYTLKEAFLKIVGGE